MPQGWANEHDVVVVGSGFAGLAAAIEAHEAGASVTVIEKLNSIGGNSKLAGGGITTVDSPKQRDAEIDDSLDRFVADTIDAGGGLNHYDLVRTLGEGSWPAVRWLIEELGCEFHEEIKHTGGHSVPRTYWASGDIGGYQIIKRAKERVEDSGIEIRITTKLEEIHVGDGGLEGVTVLADHDPRTGSGRDRQIHVTGGLVVAAGGFANDTTLVQAQEPSFEGLPTTNHPGATGEVLRELLRLGAQPLHLSYIQILPTTSPEEARASGTGLANEVAISALQHTVWIDPGTGRRFTNEAGDRRERARALLEVGNESEYPLSILDARGAEEAILLEDAVEKGVVYEFDDLGALADRFGILAGDLRTEIERYNEYVERGNDPEFGRPMAYATPLSDPPWYALRLWPKLHHTVGGVCIDSDTRVLDTYGDPIPGVYAAGEVTGGVHGQSRLTDNAIADCLVFGRIAGRRAAGDPTDLV